MWTHTIQIYAVQKSTAVPILRKQEKESQLPRSQSYNKEHYN